VRFASTMEGNRVTPDDQRRKLERVAEVARPRLGAEPGRVSCASTAALVLVLLLVSLSRRGAARARRRIDDYIQEEMERRPSSRVSRSPSPSGARS